MKRGTGDTRGHARAVWPQRTGRRAFLKGAGLAGAASLAGAVLPDSDARAATASAAFPAAEHTAADGGPSGFSPNLFTVSYYPSANAGYPMWSHYDGPQYQSDMQTARSLGFTSLRVFLAALPPSYDVFDWDTPTQDDLGQQELGEGNSRRAAGCR